MKQVMIKIHNDNKTISSQKINLQSNQPIILNAISKVNYELIDTSNGFAPDHIITKRNNDDLYILFDRSEESTIILKGFYNIEYSTLIGLSELGNYHYYTPDTGDIEDYVTLLTSSNQVSGHALGSRELEHAWWVDVTNSHSSKPTQPNRAQDSIDASYNTSYIVNTGNDLVVVDTPSVTTATTKNIASTPTVAEAATFTTNNSSSNNDVTSTDLTGTDLTGTAIATATTSSTPTSEEVSSDWTPWAIGAASVVGIGLALGSELKAVEEAPKDTIDTNSQESEDNKGITSGTSNTSNILVGDDRDNILTGTQNNEILTGGKGSDTLTGGKGADIFNYSDLTFSDLLNRDIDTITDFGNDDKIQIDSSILQDYSPSADIFDYIAYDIGTGALSLDIDASGAASELQFALLDSGLSITVQSFVII